MSFGVGVSDIIAVANIANKVRKRFVDSPAQLKAVADEVKSLSNVLRDLEDVIPERDITDQQKTDLEEALQVCRNTLTALDEVLDKYHDLASTAGRTGLAQKSRRLWKRLTFEPEDVSNLRSRLTSNISLFNAFVGSLALGISHAAKAGVDRLNTYQSKEQYLKVLNWLSSTDFPTQQNEIYKDCQEGTGQWLLKSNEYMKWIDGAEPTLFCPGIPGAGKTFLASIVIHDLHERFDGNPEVAVVCLYFNYKQHAEQTMENLLAALLKQLVQELPRLYPNLESLYKAHREGKTGPSLDELSKLLSTAVHICNKAFLVIDALDECIDSRTRLKLLKAVTALQTQQAQQAQQAQQGTVRFLTTSRFIPEIVAEFDGKPTIEIRADDGDIRRYLEHHLENLSLCVQGNQSLQAKIVTEISKAVDGMFLLAQLHLNSLYDKITTKKVNLALQQLPKGSQSLYMAYDKTIERIDNQQPGFRDLAKQTLSWIVYATRQLSVLELRHALAVEYEATELDEENLVETDEIIQACAGLVTVEQDTGVIRLVHYTTQEYFERKFLTWEPLAEEAIVRTCLSYLSFDVFKTDFPDMNSMFWQDTCEHKFKRMYLFRYAIDTWHNHAKHCWNDVVERFVFSFLEESSQILHYGAQVYLRKYRGIYQKLADVTSFKSIHFAALFDMARLVSALLQAGYNTPVVDRNKRTPLTYAAEIGHEAVAELMLRDAGIWDENGYTPLHFASRSGHESIVKLLLNCKEIDVNAQEFRCHNTPLNLAIMNDHEGVVRLLLERDEIDVSCGPFGNRDTALVSYVISGSDGVLQQLLKRNDVDLNCKNDRGETALMLAVERGKTKVSKQLLGTPGVEVHHKNHRNETLLMLAVSSILASEDLVELILNRKDIDVNCKDEDGRTALMLHATTHRGYTRDDNISRRLLEREEIDVTCRDKNGETALILAVDSHNYSAAVEMETLFEREELDVNCQNNKSRTALMFAFTSDNERGTRKLLETKNIDVNCKDKNDQTILMWIVTMRFQDIYSKLQMLLERKEIDVNCRKKNGQTALMLAVKFSNEYAVKALFEREDLDVNCQDFEGRTALMMAASKGNYSVVERFLKREEIDVNCQDYEGLTALMIAASMRNSSVVERLLEREELDVNCQDNEGRTALMIAATEYDKDEYFSRLIGKILERRDIDINCQDKDGRTVLMLAITTYKEDEALAYFLIRELLERRDIDVNCQDNNGQTALTLAASCKNYSVVDVFLKRDDIDRTGYDLEQERLSENVGSLGFSS